MDMKKYITLVESAAKPKEVEAKPVEPKTEPAPLIHISESYKSSPAIKKIVRNVMEKKAPQPPKQRNPVAKNAAAAIGGGAAGKHKDKKKDAKQGVQKHKGQSLDENDDWSSLSKGEFKRRELGQELGHETRSGAVYIDGKYWKTFDTYTQAKNVARSLERKGKNATARMLESYRPPSPAQKRFNRALEKQRNSPENTADRESHRKRIDAIMPPPKKDSPVGEKMRTPFAGAAVGHKEGPAGQLKAMDPKGYPKGKLVGGALEEGRVCPQCGSSKCSCPPGKCKCKPVAGFKPKMSEDKDPCWKNYKMVGTKKKGGKTVPNCVPKESKVDEAQNAAQQAAIAIAKKKKKDVAEAAKWRHDDLEGKTWRSADWDDGDLSPGKIQIDRHGKDVDDSGDELNARPGMWGGKYKRMTKKGTPTQHELGMQNNLKMRMKMKNKQGGLTGPKGPLPKQQGVAGGSESTKTYNDGIEDSIELLKISSGNSIDYIIDRLQDYQYAYEKKHGVAKGTGRMETYNDGIEDSIELLKTLSGNSIDYIIDRLQDYQYTYEKKQGVAEEGYGNHPSQRVDPRTGKKYVPPKSPLGQGVAEGEDWTGSLYDPDLQKGKKKPKLSDIKVKFPPKKQEPKQQGEEPKKQGVAEGSLNEFAPDGFNSGDDDEGFSPEIAKMAQEDGFTKGVSLVDGATLEMAMKINYWHSQHGGMYKQYFAKGFKQGRMNKVNHDNKQYNLNLKLMKDGSIRHGEQGVAEGGPFSYGKAPRKGTVADLAARRRKEQDRKTPPIEPKDQMVGTAKVTKDVKEGLKQILRKVDPTIKSRLRSKADRLDDEGDEVHQDLKSMGIEPHDAMTRNMDPEKYYRNADRYRRLADKDVKEGGEKYKIKSTGSDVDKESGERRDYYISPSTGKKVYKAGVKKGDHENPKSGEHKPKVEGQIAQAIMKEFGLKE